MLTCPFVDFDRPHHGYIPDISNLNIKEILNHYERSLNRIILVIDIIEWIGSQDWEQGRLFSLQEQIDHKVMLNVPLYSSLFYQILRVRKLLFHLATLKVFKN